MIRLQGKVTYLDGTVEDFTGGINALAAWEQHAHTRKLDSSPEKSPMTWTLFVAFASLGATRTGKDIGFDTWRKNVDDVSLEVEDANPTIEDTSEV